jgi:hypothetical protein
MDSVRDCADVRIPKVPAVSMDLSASAGRLASTRFLALWSVFLMVVGFGGLDGRLIRALNI